METALNDKILQTLPALPGVQEALRNHEAEIADQRKKLVAERKALSKRAEKAFVEHQAAMATALKRVRAAEAALIEARAEAQALGNRRVGEAFQLDREFERIDSALRETADPAIAVFIDEMARIITTPPQPEVIDRVVEKNEITGAREAIVVTTFARITTYLNKCRAAIEAARDLQLDADNSNIPARLQALRPQLKV